jgi:NitT/TauT family transport system substrate-binding protein
VKGIHITALLLLIVALLVTGCAARPETPAAADPVDAPLRTVTIAMGFIPNVQFTPMYVAMERGYFADEGIEVELDYGMETDLLQLVGANQIQFAIGSGDQVVLARGNGLPVTYVFNWYGRFPVCVVSMADAGIDEPADLVGRTVGTPALQGASHIGWLAFLDEVGIAPEDIDLQVIGYTQVASLIENRVDATVSYVLNEPVQLVHSGYDINVFYLDQYTHLVSNGIITNDQTIEDDPELVQAVVRAFLRGLEDTINDPDGAFEIARRAIPEMDDESAELQREVLRAAADFWRVDRLGFSDPTHWAESIEILTGLGLLTGEIDPEDLYTNRFIP